MARHTRKIRKPVFKHHFGRNETRVGDDGERISVEIDPYKATVRIPKKPVVIYITEEDVLKAIKYNGGGSTRFCTVAWCTYRNRKEFEHGIIGVVDMQRATIYIASAQTLGNRITECYMYRHNLGWVVAMNDDRKNGLARLLAYVREHGPIKFIMRPRLRRDISVTAGTGKGNDGSRSPGPVRGAKRRRLDYNTPLEAPAA